MPEAAELVKEIQEAATGRDVPLPTLLRKCYVLAQRLDNAPLREWSHKELNGYPGTDELPPYRKRRAAEVLGDFAGPFGSGFKNARIPQYVVDDDDRDFLFDVVFHQPVAELEELARSDSGMVESPWPQDFVARYAEKIYKGQVALRVTRLFGASGIVGILDAIRNKVLAFALDLEKEAPVDDGRIEPEELPAERVTHIFETHVYGDHANVLAAGRDVGQGTHEDPRFWALRHPWLTGLILGIPSLALTVFLALH